MTNPVRALLSLFESLSEARRRKREREEEWARDRKECHTVVAELLAARAEMIEEQRRLLASGAELAPPWVVENDCDWYYPQREALDDPLVRDIWRPYIRVMTPEQREAYFHKWCPPIRWRPAVYDYLKDLGDPLWGDPEAALRYGETEAADEADKKD